MSSDKILHEESALVKKFSAKVDRKARAEGERLRAQFVARAHLQPPDVLRLIDIQATCQKGQVILRGYNEVLQLHVNDPVSGSSSDLGIDYSAISHTFGMEVYSIFDCKCASTLSDTANVPPRCWDKPCPHFTGKDDCEHDVRNRVVNDIVAMCHILSRSGVRYAWHDGVCIAQYSEQELTATIKSIGWIYAAAKETIVFLHYVGKPMAPIAPRGCGYELACRWHTRVWTFQEASLSKSRRYCVRVCKISLHFNHLSGNCYTLKGFENKAKKFEQKASQWYDKNTSDIDVITEENFMDIISDALEPLQELWERVRTFKAMLEEVQTQNGAVSRRQQLAACVESWYSCIQIWFECLEDLRDTLTRTCLRFPELGAALAQCSRRDSKHVGDRINSVLTLAGLKNLVAPKDFKKGVDSMEAWTLIFFEQQGPQGLAWAVLSSNEGLAESEDLDKITHSWLPVLWRPLSGPKVGTSGYECDEYESWGIQFRVREGDGKLELKGKLLCVAVSFKLKLKEEEDDTYIHQLHEKLADDHEGAFLDSQLETILGEGSEREDHSECEVETDADGEVDTDEDGDEYSGETHDHNTGDENNGDTDTDEDGDEYSGETHDHSTGDENSGQISHDHNTGDEISIDTDCDDEAHEGINYGDEEDKVDQAYAEELFDQALCDLHEVTDMEQPVRQAEEMESTNEGFIQYAGTPGADIIEDDHEKQRMAMDIVSISIDGSHGFAVRLPEADPLDIMGMATFFPLQLLEDAGRVIGGEHIKEGESLHACLVAPLHSDWIASDVAAVQHRFLITDLNIHHLHHNSITDPYTASKIGIFIAKTKARDLLRSSHLHYLPSKIINKLVIN